MGISSMPFSPKFPRNWGVFFFDHLEMNSGLDRHSTCKATGLADRQAKCRLLDRGKKLLHQDPKHPITLSVTVWQMDQIHVDRTRANGPWTWTPGGYWIQEQDQSKAGPGWEGLDLSRVTSVTWMWVPLRYTLCTGVGALEGDLPWIDPGLDLWILDWILDGLVHFGSSPVHWLAGFLSGQNHARLD